MSPSKDLSKKKGRLEGAAFTFKKLMTAVAANNVGMVERGADDDDLSCSSQTTTPSKEAFARASIDARMRVDELYRADDQLKKARDEHEANYANEVNKLDNVKRQILDRFNQLEETKVSTVAEYGDEYVTDDDLIEINAGGKVVVARRGTLTQSKGTRMEALFSGRWDKKLLRDRDGRIFLDVNSECFQAIIVYQNELVSSPCDKPPEPPSVYDELMTMLEHQLQLFEVVVPRMMPDSKIITQPSHSDTLYDWLGDSDGEWELLYRGSRDGFTNTAFHKGCDKKGRTFVIIETADGGVLGGYTNTDWASSIGIYATADKAFLFILSGFGLASPCKMLIRNSCKQITNRHSYAYGPKFGRDDLSVDGDRVTVNIGSSYEPWPESLRGETLQCTIKEIEVFRVEGDAPFFRQPRSKTLRPSYSPAINRFTKKVNEALNKKWESLYALEAEVTQLEERYRDERHFVESLVGGDTNDVILLNVSGTMMATRRETLMIAQDSVLAQQFDDKKWTVQGKFPPVKAWTPPEVANWVKSIDISEDVASLFSEHEINGSELLALDRDGLKMLGVTRVGTICVLFDEICKLKKAEADGKVAMIEYSPYCFGKILEYLRLKHLQSANLAEEPARPTVRDSQKKLFEKIVDYYFPGDSSKFIFG